MRAVTVAAEIFACSAICHRDDADNLLGGEGGIQGFGFEGWVNPEGLSGNSAPLRVVSLWRLRWRLLMLLSS